MSVEMPRLLFVAPVMPSGGGNGLAMRQGQFLQAYARAFAVDLAVIPLAGAADADAAFAARFARRMRVFAPDGVETHFALLRRLADPAARAAAFAQYGKPSMAAGLTETLLREVCAWAGECEAVHVGRLYLLAAGVRIPADQRFVDADEDDARVYARVAALSRGAAAEWAAVEARNAARAAAGMLPQMDRVFVAGAGDAAGLAHPGLTVVPNTVKVGKLHPAPRGRGKILFVGTLGYAPNEDGICWFIRQVWPLLRRRAAGVELEIVGGGASLRLRRAARAPGITLRGRVKALGPVYQAARVVVVPLRAGGGSRIKLLEAAGAGLPVVATRLGAEGVALLPGRDFVQVDAARGFAEAVAGLLAQPARARRMGLAARRAVLRGHEAGIWQKRIAEIARRALA
jgi:glycosyltransferase involved in cell wall biosynthesis